MNCLNENGWRKLSFPVCHGFALALALMMGLGLAGCHRKTPEEMLQEASELFQSQDIMGAEMKYEKILDRHPEGPAAMAARLGLARCYLSEKEFDKGREQFDLVLQGIGTQTQDCLPVIAGKLQSYILEKKPEKAIETALATSSTLHGSPEEVRQQYQIMLADIYIVANKEDKASEICQQVIRQWPNNPALHIAALDRLCWGPQEKQDFPKAIAVYQEYLNTHPQTSLKADLLFGIGFYQQQMNQPDKANVSFDAAEADYRRQIEAALGAEAKGSLMLKLARAQQGRGNLPTAKQTLQQVIKTFPASEMSLTAKMQLSGLAMAEKKPEEAIALLREVQKERPDSNWFYLANQRIQEIQANSLRPTTATQAMGVAVPTTQTAARTTAPAAKVAATTATATPPAAVTARTTQTAAQAATPTTGSQGQSKP